jgi:sulfate permease, SulP family
MLKNFFSLHNLRGDLFGGITAGIVALPLALAFGVQSGMGAIAGLYGAIAIGFFASLFGGTPTQISGPTGPMTVVSAVVIAEAILITGSFEASIPIIIGSFVLCGLVQIALGVIGVGKYIKYMPYPVLSGFMTGIGAIIIIFQIFPLLGLKSPSDTFSVLKELSGVFGNIDMMALLLGLGTIAIIYLLPRLTKVIPSALVALLVITIISVLIPMDIPRIGDIPSGLPDLKIDVLLGIEQAHLWLILEFGVTLAFLGAIDSLLTSVVADNMTKTQHKSNQELIGQGIGNTFGGLIGGLPGAGATMRTVVNINNGGKTKLSGIFHSLILVVILFGAGSLAKEIPLAVLAGILITVGIGILDYKGLRNVRQVPRADAVIMIIVLFITVFGNLLHAVAVGLFLACILFMKNMGDISLNKIESQKLSTLETDVSIDLPLELQEEVFVKKLWGAMFFGITTDFTRLINEMPEVKYVILRMKTVPYMDQSGLYALEEAILTLESQGVQVIITGIQKQPRDLMTRIRIIPNLIEEKHLFVSLKDALDFILIDHNKPRENPE